MNRKFSFINNKFMLGNVSTDKLKFDIYLKSNKNRAKIKTVECKKVVELLDKLEPFQKPKMKFVKQQDFDVAQEYRLYQYHCLN